MKGAPSEAMSDATPPSSGIGLKQCRHGRMMYLPNDQYIGRSLDFYGEYCEAEGLVFDQLLGSGQVAIEVGANIGTHTVRLGQLVGPSGAVLAFEPQRALFYLLCANLALNELFHVRAVHAAAGAEAGSVRVPMLDHRAGLNFGGLSLPGFEVGDQVPLVPLDSVDLPSLRLLKVDVEGMEVEVLRGAGQLIMKHRPILYVENDRRDRSERLIELIMEMGYELHWHLPMLFNPQNYFGRREDIFPEIVSINMLCVPRELAVNLTGFRRITGPQDWWETAAS
jgi:FkbM family methyltransferase